MQKSLWKEVVAAAVVIVLAVAVGAFVMNRQKPVVDEHETVHYHAGFQIYVNNVLEDFSGMEYMEIAPCSPDEVHPDETVHLHNGIGDVVHVHHADMTWNNLFEYLQDRQPFMPENANIVGYVNGTKVDDIATYPITAYDSVVIFMGSGTSGVASKLEKAVTVAHVKEAEAAKENCGI